MRHVEQIDRDLRQAKKDLQNAQTRVTRYREELRQVAQSARLGLAA